MGGGDKTIVDEINDTWYFKRVKATRRGKPRWKIVEQLRRILNFVNNKSKITVNIGILIKDVTLQKRVGQKCKAQQNCVKNNMKNNVTKKRKTSMTPRGQSDEISEQRIYISMFYNRQINVFDLWYFQKEPYLCIPKLWLYLNSEISFGFIHKNALLIEKAR